MSSLRTAVGILRPAPPFPSIALSMGPNVVGRGRGGVMDPRVSREHAEISVTEDEGELSFSLKCLGALTCVSKGGVVTTLKRDDDAVPITAGDSIHLLPKLHRFELEVVGRDAAASPASHASSQPQSVLESQPPAAKRQHLEGGGASGSGGGGGGGGGSSGGVSMASGDATGGGGSGADGADGADGSEDDWLGMVLPPYVQPAKPAAMEGLSALERLATTAHAPSERVLLVTSQLVVAYDVYPKACTRRASSQWPVASSQWASSQQSVSGSHSPHRSAPPPLPSTLPSTPPPTLLPTSAAGYHVTMCSVQARRHLLILPRSQLSGPGALDSQHLPLVRSMSRH